MYFKQNIHLLIVILQLLIVIITVNMLFCSAELNNPVDPESKSYILPNAPTGVSAIAGNGQAIVTFEYPIPNGGPAVTSYTVTSTPGNIAVSGTTSPLMVTGLSNGVEYTFVVTATNVCGTSPSSVASAAIKPSTVPGTPTNVTATAGNMEAMVSFTAPATNGGSVITGYSVTSSPGGITVTGTASPLTVTGLTNGTAYTFTVKATSANGNSLPSIASTAVTPSAVPDADAPIIEKQPSSQSVTVGQTASFSVVATGTNLQYQWQKGTTNISGATYATYTTSATALSDNGSTYRCVISNSAGNVISSYVILTVSSVSASKTWGLSVRKNTWWLHDIFILDDTHIYVCGDSAQNPVQYAVFAQWEGTAFVNRSPISFQKGADQLIPRTLKSVIALSTTEIYVLGVGTVGASSYWFIALFNDTTWSIVSDYYEDPTIVGNHKPAKLVRTTGGTFYVSTDLGRVFSVQNGIWSEQGVDANGWGSLSIGSSGDVYLSGSMSGSFGNLFKFNGFSWNQIGSKSWGFSGISVGFDNSVFTVGANTSDSLYRINDNQLYNVCPTGLNMPTCIFVVNQTSVYVGDNWGRIGKYNGSSWTYTTLPAQSTKSVIALSFLANNNGSAITEDGGIYVYR